MFPNVTFVSVTDQIALIWANPLVLSLFTLSIALILFPRILRTLRGSVGRR